MKNQQSQHLRTSNSHHSLMEPNHTNSEGAVHDHAPQFSLQSSGNQASIDAPPIEPIAPTTTRSGRVTKPPEQFQDYVSTDLLFSLISVDFSALEDPIAYASILNSDMVAFSASSDPDVMHYHQALKQPDRKQFVEAMIKEITAHTEGDQVPAGHHVLPAVWAMHRKRRIDTQEVYKWKARINIHGGKQTKGLNYWDTYAPVATWSSI
jgi:hypothetical protein